MGSVCWESLKGCPQAFFLDEDKINKNLKRRQMGYGRGKRMEIEKDKVEILVRGYFPKDYRYPDRFDDQE